jgi:hypothetical protein
MRHHWNLFVFFLRSRYSSGMAETKQSPAVAEVPKQVFEQFLEELSKTNVPAETVDRLRTAILGAASLTDNMIKAALLPEKDK